MKFIKLYAVEHQLFQAQFHNSFLIQKALEKKDKLFESSCIQIHNIKDDAIIMERQRRNQLYIVALCIHRNIYYYGIISHWTKLSKRILGRIRIKRILSTRVGKYLIQLNVKTEHLVFSLQAFFTCHYYHSSIR